MFPNNNSVTAPRTVGKAKSDGKIEDEELARLSRKKDSLKAAADDLYDEIAKIEQGIIRRNEVLKREEDARKEKAATSDLKAQAEAAKIDLDEKQLRRREILKKMEAKLRAEQELQAIGRHQLNDDIKRHQCVVLGVIGSLKQRVAQERQEFLNAVISEVDSFKLPSADVLFGTQNEALIAELKGMCDECLQICN